MTDEYYRRTAIGENARVKGPTLQLEARRRLFSFTEGYAIRVQIKEIDFLKLQVFLELADQRSR